MLKFFLLMIIFFMLSFIIVGGKALLKIYKTIKQTEKNIKEQAKSQQEGYTKIENLNNNSTKINSPDTFGEYVDYEEIKND